MNLKHLLPVLGIAVFALSAPAASRKPNFLFIYTDDQRYDAMGVVQREQGEKGRYPWFKTPNMDRIAGEGVRFRNAFVTLPLCAPSRAVFLSGVYNHLNGVAGNRVPFPETNITHASILTRAGYKTAYIGKWHMGGQRGKRPGFDYSASFIGQGRYFDCDFEINGAPVHTKGWVDDVSTDYAIKFIRENQSEPFSLVLGFKTCHSPTVPPERAKDRFSEVRARTVPNLSSRAPFVQNEDDQVRPKPSADGTVPVNINYFRCLSAIDDNVGRLLELLDELKLANHTAVIFTSDNGYYHGEHGLGDKRSGYDESLRVPFVVRCPALVLKPAVLDHMILNTDLAPTVLDLAGLPIPPKMQGMSWKRLLTGDSKDWREAFLFEYFRENAFPATPTMVGIRTTNAKLITYPGHEEWTEMFDLQSDPYEMTNLVGHSETKSMLNGLRKQLESQKQAVSFQIPDYADKARPDSDVTRGKKGKRKNRASISP